MKTLTNKIVYQILEKVDIKIDTYNFYIVFQLFAEFEMEVEHQVDDLVNAHVFYHIAML